MPAPRPVALLSASECARDRGALADARALAEQAWPLIHTKDAALRRRAGLLLMNLRYRLGALAATVELAQEVLPMLREQGPATVLIDTLRMVTLCATEISHFTQQCLAYAQEAHRLALQIDDTGRLSMVTNALGCFFDRAGDPWQAERLMFEALGLARQQTEGLPLTAALNNLGAVLIGKFYLLRDALPLEEAREPLRMALPFLEELSAMQRQGGEVFHKVFTLGNLGEILVHLGQADEAARLLDEATELALSLGAEAQLWRLGCSQGELLLVRGRPAEAWACLNEVLHASVEVEQRTIHLRLHHALSRAAAELGRHADALRHLQTYLVLERQRAVAQLRAQSELFVTRMESEQLRRDAQHHDARARALEADVHQDQLTGLGNRRALEARMSELVHEVDATNRPFSLAMLDLDHFKKVNDRHGHAVGDRVLVALAGVLLAHTRSTDLVVRMGGEEFLLVLPDTGAEQAAEICERLLLRLADHDWGATAPGLTVTASIGLTSAPPLDPHTLSLRADEALYRAKEAGRNRLVQI